jgi:hypothetical protein
MAYLQLTTAGRLLTYEAVGDPAAVGIAASDSVDWSRLFEEAGLDTVDLEQIEGVDLVVSRESRRWQGPRLAPSVPVDHMEAWIGLSPWGEQDSIRVRAGAFKGRPVFFATDVTYDAVPDSASAGGASGSTIVEAVEGSEDETGHGSDYGAGVVIGLILGFAVLVLVLAVLIGGPLMAWRHLRMGKGDRRGALRFGLFTLGLILLSSLLRAHHAILVESGSINLGYELNMVMLKIGSAVLYGAYIALAYLALEPYVRRHWPDALISWTRLVGGRIGDPLVGRDMLLGGATGVLAALIWQLGKIAPVWFGWPPPRPHGVDTYTLQGGARAVAAFLEPSFLWPSLLSILALVLLVIVFRKRWIALTVLPAVILGIGALFAFEGAGGQYRPALLTVIAFSMLVAMLLVLFLRSGLLALTVAFLFFSKLRSFPVCLDSSAWYSGTSTLALLALAALALYAFWNTVRGYPKHVAGGPDRSPIELPPAGL